VEFLAKKSSARKNSGEMSISYERFSLSDVWSVWSLGGLIGLLEL